MNNVQTLEFAYWHTCAVSHLSMMPLIPCPPFRLPLPINVSSRFYLGWISLESYIIFTDIWHPPKICHKAIFARSYWTALALFTMQGLFMVTVHASNIKHRRTKRKLIYMMHVSCFKIFLTFQASYIHALQKHIKCSFKPAMMLTMTYAISLLPEQVCLDYRLAVICSGSPAQYPNAMMKQDIYQALTQVCKIPYACSCKWHVVDGNVCYKN